MHSCKETATIDSRTSSAEVTKTKTVNTRLKLAKRVAYLGGSAYAFILCILPPLTTIICDPGSPWGH